MLKEGQNTYTRTPSLRPIARPATLGLILQQRPRPPPCSLHAPDADIFAHKPASRQPVTPLACPSINQRGKSTSNRSVDVALAAADVHDSCHGLAAWVCRFSLGAQTGGAPEINNNIPTSF